MGGGTVTRREMLIFVVLAVAMIAAGLTWIFGPWGLVGTGVVMVIGVLLFVNEVDEPEKEKPDA
jgi:hypothetical protein